MKRTSKSTKLPCAFCQGKGTQPGAERLSCIVCKGRGRVMARQPFRLCKECGGRGRKKGANLYCWQCHGKGFVESSAPKTRSSDVPTLRREPKFRPPLRKKKRKKRKDKFNKRKSYKLVELKKRGKKPVALPAGPETLDEGPEDSNRSRQAKVRKEKVIVKEERKSPPTSRLGRKVLRVGFFKKLFGAIKIL